MPNPVPISAAILETVLNGIAALFLAGANGDATAARHAASEMLEAYRPRTQDELCLVAIIVGCSFRALDALGQSAAPDLPLTRVLRLHGSAVSLSREAAKAERRLAQIRKAAPVDAPVQAMGPRAPEPAPPEPAPPEPVRSGPASSEPASIETKFAPRPGTVAQAAKAKGVSWTQAYNDRQRDNRIAASLKRAEARFGAKPRATIPPPMATARS